MTIFLAFILAILLAIVLGGLIVLSYRPAPTAICKWCGVILYTPVSDHADVCPEFRLMCHRAILRAIEEYEMLEKAEKGSVQ